MRRATAVLAFTAGCLTGCLPPIAPAADNPIDLRYRLGAGDRGRSATTTATELYRWIGERSLSVPSRCKMAPTDSEAFAIRAQRCGGVAAWYWGIARLMLEQAGSERFTRSTRLDGRLRWIDLPAGCESGSP